MSRWPPRSGSRYKWDIGRNGPVAKNPKGLIMKPMSVDLDLRTTSTTGSIFGKTNGFLDQMGDTHHDRFALITTPLTLKPMSSSVSTARKFCPVPSARSFQALAGGVLKLETDRIMSAYHPPVLGRGCNLPDCESATENIHTPKTGPGNHVRTAGLAAKPSAAYKKTYGKTCRSPAR